MDQVCKAQVDHSLQFLPENSIQFFARPLETLKSKKTKKEAKVVLKRPGWESSLKTGTESSIQKK